MTYGVEDIVKKMNGWLRTTMPGEMHHRQEEPSLVVPPS
jgi:hypothetical protein